MSIKTIAFKLVNRAWSLKRLMDVMLNIYFPNMQDIIGKK